MIKDEVALRKNYLISGLCEPRCKDKGKEEIMTVDNDQKQKLSGQ